MNEIINEIIFKMIAMKVFEYTRIAAVILVLLSIAHVCFFTFRLLEQLKQLEEEEILMDSLAGDGFIVMARPVMVEIKGNKLVKVGEVEV